MERNAVNIKIVEQPPKYGHTFRYNNEKKKIYGSMKIKIKLENIQNTGSLLVWLICAEDNIFHPYKLAYEKTNVRDVHTLQNIGNGEHDLEFAVTAIKLNKQELLLRRKNCYAAYQILSDGPILKDIPNNKDVFDCCKGHQFSDADVEHTLNFNIHQCRLKLQFCYLDDTHLLPWGEPVFSSVINDARNKVGFTPSLSSLMQPVPVTDTVAATGRACGGTELILFCDKIDDKDICVSFSKEDWCVKVIPTQIHQGRIHVMSPPFKNQPLKNYVDVSVHLQRKTDDECRSKKEFDLTFRYITDEFYDDYGISRKRKKQTQISPIENLTTEELLKNVPQAVIQGNPFHLPYTGFQLQQQHQQRLSFPELPGNSYLEQQIEPPPLSPNRQSQQQQQQQQYDLLEDLHNSLV